MMRRVRLSWMLAAAISAVPLYAAEVSVKSLSGPPEEMADMGLPSARETAVPTNLLRIDDLTQELNGPAPSARAQISNFSTTPGVGFSLVQVTTQYPTFAPATFTAPNGTRFLFNGSTLTCNGSFCGASEAALHIERLAAPSTGGIATISISGGEVSGGSWNVNVQNPGPLPVGSIAPLQVESTVAFDDNVVEVQICTFDEICLEEFRPTAQPGERFGLVDGATPVLRLSFANEVMRQEDRSAGLSLTGLTVTVTDVATQRTVHQERFHGSRAAEVPLDRAGASLIRLPNLAAGNYAVRLDVQGSVDGIGPIERTAVYFLPVLAERFAVTGEVETQVLDDERLELVLGLSPRGNDRRHVYAYAEVWSRGDEQPIAWIGGMTQPRIDRFGQLGLPMVLDARWLALKESRGQDLELRNLRIQDPDTFVPLTEVGALPFSVRQMPRVVEESSRNVSQDESLFVGRGDRTITVDDLPDEPTRGGFTNTGIFLVHGWCSGNVWPIGGHFGLPGRAGGTELFTDFDQSRSHDNFAQRIRDQGAARFIDSFSVVAHSQGGAAAVHTRAFYNTLLDASTAPRRIQSVGTPYRGSTLMDFYLATGPLGWLIATILGECTPQFSLGTLGSALWRVTVPSWAKSEVWYYRSGHRRPSNFFQRLQFWRWRCNLASFVIPGWDDGVVSTAQGVLSNGRNMGVTASECHLNMNHGGQTRNQGRNNLMDREGRPALVNLARGASTSASSTYTPGCSGGLHCYSPARVNDGDRRTDLGGFTSWTNHSTSLPQWVQLHWASPITFQRVELVLSQGWAIRNFRIEYRANALSPWRTLVNVSGNTNAVLGPYNAPFPGSATAQDIRVVGLSGPSQQPQYVRVNEIEVY